MPVRTRVTVPLLAVGVLLVAAAQWWQPASSADAAPTVTATTIVSPWQSGDARILSCGPGATARVSITNSGTSEGAYRVQIAYRDTAGRVVSSGILEGRVGAGQTRTADAPGPAVGSIAACAIADVWRL